MAVAHSSNLPCRNSPCFRPKASPAIMNCWAKDWMKNASGEAVKLEKNWCIRGVTDNLSPPIRESKVCTCVTANSWFSVFAVAGDGEFVFWFFGADLSAISISWSVMGGGRFPASEEFILGSG